MNAYDLKHFELFSKIEKALLSEDKIIVAIDGNCSAGKTTLGNRIAEIFEANLFHMDDFYLTNELRTQERLNEAGGNVDYIRFKDEILDNLRSDKGSFSYRKYNCQNAKLSNPIEVNSKRLNIVEGSYSMHPVLRPYYDLTVFLQIDSDVQKERIFKRNGAQMLTRFVNEWIPLENKYFDELDIKKLCNIVFDESQ